MEEFKPHAEIEQQNEPRIEESSVEEVVAESQPKKKKNWVQKAIVYGALVASGVVGAQKSAEGQTGNERVKAPTEQSVGERKIDTLGYTFTIRPVTTELNETVSTSKNRSEELRWNDQVIPLGERTSIGVLPIAIESVHMERKGSMDILTVAVQTIIGGVKVGEVEQKRFVFMPGNGSEKGTFVELK